MKKAIFILVSVFSTCIASAQVKVSVVACPQLNECFGARVGSDLDIPINHRWSFDPGVYWSLRNREKQSNSTKNNSTKSEEYRDKAHFITLPLRFGFQFHCKKEENFALKLLFGPYVAYGIGGNSKYTIVQDGITTHHKTGAFDSDGRYNSRFDYGLNVCLNSTIKQHFKAGIFCEYGLPKIYRTDNALENILGEIFLVNRINVAFGVTLGYQF